MKACSSGYFEVFLGRLMLAGTALGLSIPCSAAVLDVVHHQGIDWNALLGVEAEVCNNSTTDSSSIYLKAAAVACIVNPHVNAS